MQFSVNRKLQEEIGYNLDGGGITHESELFNEVATSRICSDQVGVDRKGLHLFDLTNRKDPKVFRRHRPKNLRYLLGEIKVVKKGIDKGPNFKR